MFLRKKWPTLLTVMLVALVLIACSKEKTTEGSIDDEAKPEDFILLSEGLEKYPVWIETKEELEENSEISGVYVFENDKVKKFNLSELSLEVEEIVDMSDRELVKIARANSTADAAFLDGEYNLNIILDESGQNTESMQLEVQGKIQDQFTFHRDNIHHAILDTTFSGFKINEHHHLFTRVDDANISFLLDDPDTEKKNVTIATSEEENIAEQEEETTDMDEGEEIYAQTCAACHGDDLSGSVGPSLLEVGDKFSEEEIKDIAENGRESMPAGIADAEEAQIIAEWLSETQK